MSTKYIGLDVHQATTTMFVLDQQGKVIEQMVMQTDGHQLRERIASITGKKELAFEEGTMSDWLYYILKPVVHRLVVCDPRAIRRMAGASKNDAIDARLLANELRMNNLRPVFHQTSALEALRASWRSYEQLTRDLTRTKNRLKALYRSRGIRTEDSLYEPESRAALLERLDHRELRQRAGLLFEQLDFLAQQKERASQHMVSCARKHQGYRLIKSVPGFGPVRAATVLSTVVTPHRFGNKRKFWSYCGLAVVVRTTGDWKMGPNGLVRVEQKQTRGLNKNRNAAMKEAFKSAAIQAIKASPFQEFAEAYRQRGLAESLTRVVVARKLAAIVLTIWKKGEMFDRNKL